MDSNRRAKLLKATVCSQEHPCGKFYSYLGLFSHNPNGVYPLPPPPASFVATGNFVKTENAQYNSILTFSGNGTFSVYSRPLGFNYIIVGGGGGGGGGGDGRRGGAGRRGGGHRVHRRGGGRRRRRDPVGHRRHHHRRPPHPGPGTPARYTTDRGGSH